jgi:hypothetical protein
MKTLTVQEFADAVGDISHDTVTRLVKSGDIKGSKKNPFARTSPILIPASEVDRFKRLVNNEQAKHSTRDMA